MSPLRWGVVGLGRAGRARAEAIRNDPRAELVGGFRGDTSGTTAFPSLDALLAAVDAVAICSPDDTHREYTRRALDSKVHVVCEFPLAPSAAEARALYVLARVRAVVLHTEHIELLTPDARWLRGRCVGRRLLSGTLRFTSAPRAGTASIAHANISRLHRAVDAIGMPTGVSVQQRGAHLLRATLLYEGGDGLELELLQEEGARRRMELSLRLDDGDVMVAGGTVFEKGAPVALPASPGLFATDQLAASATILDGALPYADEDRVVAVLALADELARAAPRLPPDEEIPTTAAPPKPTAEGIDSLRQRRGWKRW